MRSCATGFLAEISVELLKISAESSMLLWLQICTAHQNGKLSADLSVFPTYFLFLLGQTWADFQQSMPQKLVSNDGIPLKVVCRILRAESQK